MTELLDQLVQLIAIGYDLGITGADGIVGARTDKAIKAFQTASGLSSDGIVGKDTRAALLASWASLNGA